MPGECCDMRRHWQEKLPGPGTSLQLSGTTGKTVCILVLFGGTLDPSLMLMRDILKKLKEMNVFHSIDLFCGLWERTRRHK